jgi:hypothetical protein
MFSRQLLSRIISGNHTRTKLLAHRRLKPNPDNAMVTISTEDPITERDLPVAVYLAQLQAQDPASGLGDDRLTPAHHRRLWV